MYTSSLMLPTSSPSVNVEPRQIKWCRQWSHCRRRLCTTTTMTTGGAALGRPFHRLWSHLPHGWSDRPPQHAWPAAVGKLSCRVGIPSPTERNFSRCAWLPPAWSKSSLFVHINYGWSWPIFNTSYTMDLYEILTVVQYSQHGVIGKET